MPARLLLATAVATVRGDPVDARPDDRGRPSMSDLRPCRRRRGSAEVHLAHGANVAEAIGREDVVLVVGDHEMLRVERDRRGRVAGDRDTSSPCRPPRHAREARAATTRTGSASAPPRVTTARTRDASTTSAGQEETPTLSCETRASSFAATSPSVPTRVTPTHRAGRRRLSHGKDPRARSPLLDATGKSNPRVCFVGTASGDAESARYKFYEAMAPLGVRATHLSLFQPPTHDLAAFVRTRMRSTSAAAIRARCWPCGASGARRRAAHRLRAWRGDGRHQRGHDLLVRRTASPIPMPGSLSPLP